jgi:hypothetical protein
VYKELDNVDTWIKFDSLVTCRQGQMFYSKIAVIVAAASLHYFALSAGASLFDEVSHGDAASFSADAGFILLALLVFGYWPLAGVAVGAILWDISNIQGSLLDYVALEVFSASGGLLALWTFDNFIAPNRVIRWKPPRFSQIILFALIFSFLSAVMRQLGLVFFFTGVWSWGEVLAIALTKIGAIFFSLAALSLLLAGWINYRKSRKAVLLEDG